MDLEAPPVNDDAFHEEAEDGLPGVEVGVLELGPEGVDEFLRAADAMVCHVHFKLLGLELREGVLGGEAAVVEGVYARAEDVE